MIFSSLIRFQHLKMKFTAVLLLAFAVAVTAGPLSIQDNNVGDIVTVGINANVKLSNQIDQNIVNVIVGILNQQALLVRGGGDGENKDNDVPKWPESRITPEMIERVREFLANRNSE